MGSSVALGASWEHLGRVLAASWGDLGSSGRGVLGPLGAALEPLGAVFCRYVGTICFFNYFWIDVGSFLKLKRLPKRIQNGAKKRIKIEHKFQHQKRTLSRPSWNRLGPVLGRFGVDFGIKNNENSLFLSGFMNITFLKKITFGRAS